MCEVGCHSSNTICCQPPLTSLWSLLYLLLGHTLYTDNSLAHAARACHRLQYNTRLTDTGSGAWRDRSTKRNDATRINYSTTGLVLLATCRFRAITGDYKVKFLGHQASHAAE